MDDFFIPNVLAPSIHRNLIEELDNFFNYITDDDVLNEIISESIDVFLRDFITVPSNIPTIEHLISTHGYVPTTDNIFNLLESMELEKGLHNILRLMLTHSESGFNRLYPHSIDFIDRVIYEGDLWGEIPYTLHTVGVLIRDYISRKDPNQKVELDDFFKVVINKQSKYLLKIILQVIYEYELKNHDIQSDTIMEIFEFVIGQRDKSLFNLVYYLFIEYLGIQLTEEQLSKLFELAGKSNNTDILEYLQERTSPTQRKRMLDAAFVSAIEDTKQKRQRHSPVVKHLLQQPEMNIIPHQAYQASSESPYENLSDMFYQHNELLYRPGTGTEYKIALDRFNVNRSKLP